MPYRFIPLANDEYYHVFNRGVASQPTFGDKKDYDRFLLCLDYYRHKKVPLRLSKLLQLPKDERESLIQEMKKQNDIIVEIIAYCLMPNHFHLLLKQVSDNGISTFLRLVTNSYARYYNSKYQRNGSVFQGVFKTVHVQTDEQFIHLSRYIHLNPLVSFLVKEENFLSYPWSSLNSYLNVINGLVNPEKILANFSSPKKYLQFVLDQADYGKELEKIKHLILE